MRVATLESGGKPSTVFPPEGTRRAARYTCRVSLIFSAPEIFLECIVRIFAGVFVAAGSPLDTPRLDFGVLN